jgi:hypothetical protein
LRRATGWKSASKDWHRWSIPSGSFQLRSTSFAPAKGEVEIKLRGGAIIPVKIEPAVTRVVEPVTQQAATLPR